ncbi:MAG: hypothetical protein ACO1SV_00180 [Fimbriimonas sp.]
MSNPVRWKYFAGWAGIALGVVLAPFAYGTYFRDRMDLTNATRGRESAFKDRARFSEVRFFACLALVGGGIVLVCTNHPQSRS